MKHNGDARFTERRAKWKSFRKKLHRWWMIFGLSALVLMSIGQFFAYRAIGPAPNALQSDAAVQVSFHPTYWLFEPAKDSAKKPQDVGLIFFPGSLVDPAAYAPLARRVAAEGYMVAIFPLPFRCAPSEAYKAAVLKHAADMISASARSNDSTARQSPSHWIIGGHSLGGALAARFGRDYPDLTGGLLLIGTSHPRRFDLSRLHADVVKVSGSQDGLASPEEVRQFAKNLPASTRFVEIQGGNHAQFGWYSFQLGDKTPTITQAEQQTQLARTTLDMLQRFIPRKAATTSGPPL
jgi:pimeloyl-ACP methyl ester carboxylesterase